MKKIGILAALLGGFYLVTKKDTIKKQLTSIGSNDIAGVLDDFSNSVRPSKKNPSSGPGDYSEVPSPTGGKITIEGGTLNLAADLMGYRSYEQVGANWQPKIAKVPQYIRSLEGKIFTTEFGETYVVLDGYSYRVMLSHEPIQKWGILHPEDAIPVSNVPMYFLDKYPMKGFFLHDFVTPTITN